MSVRQSFPVPRAGFSWVLRRGDDLWLALSAFEEVPREVNWHKGLRAAPNALHQEPRTSPPHTHPP